MFKEMSKRLTDIKVMLLNNGFTIKYYKVQKYKAHMHANNNIK